ncbi:MAG: hypothetical protein DSM107014_11350 [Gomphosphaeria aponina SAG 52.96 = DSM 107014]|uniref:Lipoprotein n=1 Tax=Gomphosphaeria aponina SAG 52.96 = DSM 107014 TaxID=1521640 RepID=A0A941JV83_9CHRO|nr:hypothetical protein [Gomphosphaeria aponina SAG 52.96 = DSM 107014]
MKVLRLVLATNIIIWLTACSTQAPPTELAPEPEIVKKAIALQLNLTQTQLTQKLNAATPALEIGQINVKQLEPIFIAKLPAYHLQGTYDLTIKLPRQQAKQKNNPFEIYLQRQIEGKTWRLLKRETSKTEEKTQWNTYLIK